MNKLREQRQAVIVTGGALGEWALPYIRHGDYIIGADSGAAFLVRHGIAPDLAIGDFDSVSPAQLSAVRAAAREWRSVDAVDKDWTDTEMAMRTALERSFSRITLIGGLGTRFDHALANVHLLKLAHEQGAEAELIDEFNEIRLCARECRLRQDERFPYLSLLPLTSVVRGVTLSGFQYPLDNATIRIGESIGISNRLLAPEGVVSVLEGQLLVIRSRD